VPWHLSGPEGGTLPILQMGELSQGNRFVRPHDALCSPGDDISSLQQEITILRECRHPNVVAYIGSYLR
jgi:hypothetical protein